MSSDIRVFDRNAVRQHRERAATRFADHDFLFQEAADRLSDRLLDVSRNFDRALILGGRGAPNPALIGAGRKITEAVTLDPTTHFANGPAGEALVGDAEFLPFAPGSFDLVFSVLDMHWINDLPGALVQLRRALKPDGLLLASIFGAETLQELRPVLMTAEAETMGGVSPRISPFADVRDCGSLLQRAGFALPVTDAETLTVHYGDPLRLFADLRGMGEQNAVAERMKHFTRRATLFQALQAYIEQHGNDAGQVPATFQIINLTGWAPDESQPKPMKPGSATQSLAEALGTTEKKV